MELPWLLGLLLWFCLPYLLPFIILSIRPLNKYIGIIKQAILFIILPANLSPCLKELRRSLGYTNKVIKGRFKPRCKIDGSYEERQCLEFGVRNETCWCVDSDGKELIGTRVSGKASCVTKTGKERFYNGLFASASLGYSLHTPERAVISTALGCSIYSYVLMYFCTL